MKTYIEISRPSTSKIITSHMMNLLSSVQASTDKKRALTWKKCIALLLLLLVCLALHLRCNLFSIIMAALFFIALGVAINEFIQYIRFIRDME